MHQLVWTQSLMLNLDADIKRKHLTVVNEKVKVRNNSNNHCVIDTKTQSRYIWDSFIRNSCHKFVLTTSEQRIFRLKNNGNITPAIIVSFE